MMLLGEGKQPPSPLVKYFTLAFFIIRDLRILVNREFSLFVMLQP
jgi:hypothetical protein